MSEGWVEVEPVVAPLGVLQWRSLPSARRVVTLGDDGVAWWTTRGKPQRRWVRSEPLTLWGSPRFAAAGQLVYLVGHHLHRWCPPAARSTSVELPEPVRELAVSPDAELVATRSRRQSVWTIRTVADGAALWTTPKANRVSFSPDGAFVLASFFESQISGRDLQEMWVFDARSGERLAHGDLSVEDERLRWDARGDRLLWGDRGQPARETWVLRGPAGRRPRQLVGGPVNDRPGWLTRAFGGREERRERRIRHAVDRLRRYARHPRPPPSTRDRAEHARTDLETILEDAVANEERALAGCASSSPRGPTADRPDLTPAEAESTSRFRGVVTCPTCGTAYRYVKGYDWYVTGSEDYEDFERLDLRGCLDRIAARFETREQLEEAVDGLGLAVSAGEPT